VHRALLLVAAANGFLAVALGAFGAHGLETRLEGLADAAERLAWWETAAHYHLVHALAIAVAALVAGAAALPEEARSAARRPARLAGWAFLTGIALFSGSLYTMTLTGIAKLGAVTPLGGVALLAGWLLLARAAWRSG
jgi:uncharacterized membrane protein YgdD (TMEM256/DUF423 family)